MRLPPLPTEDEEDREGAFNLSGSERTESQRRVPSVLTVFIYLFPYIFILQVCLALFHYLHIK